MAKKWSEVLATLDSHFLHILSPELQKSPSKRWTSYCHIKPCTLSVAPTGGFETKFKDECRPRWNTVWISWWKSSRWDLLGGLKSWVGCWNLDQGWRWGIPSWSTTPRPWRCDERCPLGFGVMHCVIWNLIGAIRFLWSWICWISLWQISIYTHIYICKYIYNM